MLQTLIEEILLELKLTKGNVDENVAEILKILKETAKKIFFEGNIQDLKDFLFNHPNENNETTKKIFMDNLGEVIEDSGLFLDRLRDKVNAKIDDLKQEKNVESLLDLFDYGHLKGFLKMFKI